MASNVAMLGGKEKLGFKAQPGHFPEGTVFQVDDFVAHKEFGPAIVMNTFTVDHIVNLGPREWAISTKELHHNGASRDRPGPFCYNLGHVIKIHKRGDGNVRMKLEHSPSYCEESVCTFLHKNQYDIQSFFERNDVPVPKVKKHEHIFLHHERLLYKLIETFGVHYRTEGRHVDDDRFIRFMLLHNWGRILDVRSTEGELFFVYIFNIKKMNRWLKKNHHRVFKSLKDSAKHDDSIINKAVENLEDIDWL